MGQARSFQQQKLQTRATRCQVILCLMRWINMLHVMGRTEPMGAPDSWACVVGGVDCSAPQGCVL